MAIPRLLEVRCEDDPNILTIIPVQYYTRYKTGSSVHDDRGYNSVPPQDIHYDYYYFAKTNQHFFYKYLDEMHCYIFERVGVSLLLRSQRFLHVLNDFYAFSLPGRHFERVPLL